MNSIILHGANSTEVTPEELQAVRTPDPSATWTPIPHAALIESVKREITMGDLAIAHETLVVSNARSGVYGDRFFGLLEIQSSDESYRLTVAVRNAHDRMFPAGLCVGSRVLICDNLAFSAEVVIARKHTKYIQRDLPRLIHEAVGKLGDLHERQTRRIAAYQETALSDAQFHDVLVRSLDARVICASKLPQVLEVYRKPVHEEFASRTVWSGFNAFTEVLKAYDLQDLPRRTQALHGLCDQLSHLS